MLMTQLLFSFFLVIFDNLFEQARTGRCAALAPVAALCPLPFTFIPLPFPPEGSFVRVHPQAFSLLICRVPCGITNGTFPQEVSLVFLPRDCPSDRFDRWLSRRINTLFRLFGTVSAPLSPSNCRFSRLPFFLGLFFLSPHSPGVPPAAFLGRFFWLFFKQGPGSPCSVKSLTDIPPPSPSFCLDRLAVRSISSLFNALCDATSLPCAFPYDQFSAEGCRVFRHRPCLPPL